MVEGPGGRGLRLLDRLRGEVEAASRAMEADPVRPLPEEVELGDVPLEYGYHSGAVWRDRGSRIVFSAELGDRLEAAVRREAFYLLMPRGADDVPQTMDLAWAYSGADRGWWERCTSRMPSAELPVYDAPRELGPLRGERLLGVLRAVLWGIRAADAAGRLDVKTYRWLLMAATGSRGIRLSRAESDVLRAILRDPLVRRRNLPERAGVSNPTVSRALRKLLGLGVISGPKLVNFSAMGLSTVVLTVPRTGRGEVEAISRFPFTYRVYLPVAAGGPVHATMLLPRGALARLARGLRRGRAQVSVAVRSKIGVRLDVEEDPGRVVDLMARAFASAGPTPPRRRLPDPKFRRRPLDAQDVRILARIHAAGDVTSGQLRRMGIRSAEERLRRLRDEGYFLEMFHVAGSGLGEPVVLRLSVGENDFVRAFKALAAASSTVAMYLEGDFRGVWAICYAAAPTLPTFLRTARALFGEDLRSADLVLDATTSSWRIPVELWDEGRGEFRWEEAVGELVAALGGSE